MTAVAQLLATADGVLARREAVEPALALCQGRPVQCLGTLDPVNQQADAVFFQDAYTQLAGLAATALTPAQDGFRRALMVDLTHRIDGAPFRILDFVVAPYTGGDLHAEAQQALAEQPLACMADAEAYAALVRDYARLAREMLAHTTRQQAQGLYLAAPALPAARATLRAVIDALPNAVRPAGARLTALSPASREALQGTVESRVVAATATTRIPSWR